MGGGRRGQEGSVGVYHHRQPDLFLELAAGTNLNRLNALNGLNYSKRLAIGFGPQLQAESNRREEDVNYSGPKSPPLTSLPAQSAFRKG